MYDHIVQESMIQPKVLRPVRSDNASVANQSVVAHPSSETVFDELWGAPDVRRRISRSADVLLASDIIIIIIIINCSVL